MMRKGGKNHGHPSDRLTTKKEDRSGRGDPESKPRCATDKIDVAEHEASLSGAALSLLHSYKLHQLTES